MAIDALMTYSAHADVNLYKFDREFVFKSLQVSLQVLRGEGTEKTHSPKKTNKQNSTSLWHVSFNG